MRERVCFTGAGASDDQEWTGLHPLVVGQGLAMGHCLTLRSVELFEV
jgi:hypothetical protein